MITQRIWGVRKLNFKTFKQRLEYLGQPIIIVNFVRERAIIITQSDENCAHLADLSVGL